MTPTTIRQLDVLDAPVRTLRLHDLFREALQRRLQLDRPDDWRALMRRAAALEDDPLREQAMLIAASCFDEAARALLVSGTELNISGAASTTLRLVDAFPADFIASKAELQRVSGIAKLSVWRFQEAERHFTQAEALYAARGDTGAAQTMATRRMQAMIALGRLDDCAAILESLRGVPLIEVEARLIAATVTMWLHLERLAREQPTTLACMHGSAFRGDGAALLRALAQSLSARHQLRAAA